MSKSILPYMYERVNGLVVGLGHFGYKTCPHTNLFEKEGFYGLEGPR